MHFHLYNRLMGLAKESLQNEGETPEGEESGGTNPAVGRGHELVDLGPDTDPEILVLVNGVKEILQELPKSNMATLRYIIRHLRRSARSYWLKGNGKAISRHLQAVGFTC